MLWLEQSELVLGLLWKRRITAANINVNMFAPPINAVVNDFVSGKTPESIITTHGNAIIHNAVERASSINGLGNEVDQVLVLEQVKNRFAASQRLKKLQAQLEDGMDIKWSELAEISKQGQQDKADYYVTMDTIEARPVPFMLSGYPPLDEHIGGLPVTGLIVTGGDPGSGKTSLWISIAKSFLKEYPDKCVAFNTLEMLNEELKMRANEVKPEITKDEQKRFYLGEHKTTPEEIVNRASTIKNLGLVIADYADYLVPGVVDESRMAHVYRTFSEGSKELGIPFVLIAQLNRQMYDIPRPYHLRYSSMAEAMSSMIIMCHNPLMGYRDQDLFKKKKNEEKEVLTTAPGIAWILFWKCKGGFRVYPEKGPIAVAVDYKPSTGWGKQTRKSDKWIIPLSKI